MALFGGQVQTASYQSPDYGPSVAAYKDLAMAGAQGVSNIAGQVGDYFKQQGEKKKLVKQSSLQIDAALQLFPDLAPSLQSVKERMRDENIPLADRAAEAEVVANLINMGVGEMRNRSNMSFRQDQALADAIYKEQKLGMEERRTRATEFSAMQGAKPTFDLKEATITSPDGKTFKKDIPYDKEKGMFFDPDAGKYIQDINKWGFGEPAYAEDMPPTSQINYDQLPSSNNFGFTSKTRDLLPKSTADARQVSLDFNAAPSKNAKGVEIIIPNDASAIERAAAMDYVNKTQQYFAERGVEVPVRGVRTAKENGRGTPGRFHTEPFFVGHAEARKVMESDPDGYAQVLADTLGRIPNVTFIAPHKTNDPGASDGKFNERDFAKGSIIPALERLSRGDLSKQAMGTPEQQAEIASMIEQGAGMATSQVAPGGAMPTEPRIAQPQPAAQQAPQYKVRPGFVPVGGGAAQGTIMNAEQVKNLTDRGFKVDAIPTNDGNFMVSGVTAGGQTPRYTKTPQEELETRRLTNLDQLQSDVRATGVSAAQDIAPFKEIVGLLDASVKTGFGRQTLMTAKKILGADVSNEEQFQARVGELAMRNIALTKGAISDREMDYFKTVLSPNMGKTTEGNKKIIEFKLKYAERANTIAKIISKMQSQNADPYVIQSEIDKIIESTPLVTVGSTPTSPSSQAEADASFLQGFQSGE
jgi:hypothetical protein